MFWNSVSKQFSPLTSVEYTLGKSAGLVAPVDDDPPLPTVLPDTGDGLTVLSLDCKLSLGLIEGLILLDRGEEGAIDEDCLLKGARGVCRGEEGDKG